MGFQDEKLIYVLERLAKDLERVLVGIFVCAGLLGCILFFMVVRTLIGR